ncbi:MAG: Rieske 2Fe-2S domain-containing protein [Betaproteobacteria bacterium]|nr:Rieske 2Fe-2S domain-containing protein [Betaproteobacteria bacterium]
MAKTLLCKVSEVRVGALKQVETGDGREVCVVHAESGFFACRAYCPHQGTALCEGSIDGTTLTCLEHLWQWDLRTGETLGLAAERLEVYPVKVENGSVFLIR